MWEGGEVDVYPYTVESEIVKRKGGSCVARVGAGLRLAALVLAALVWTASPNPVRAQEAGTVTVTVQQGTGSGLYMPGDLVTVGADAAPTGQVFLRWDGDVGSLTDPFAATTMLSVPMSDVMLAPLYGVTSGASVVTFTSHTDGAIVDEKGFSVFGFVEDPAGFAGLTATVQIDGIGPVPELTNVPLSVGPNTGQFALRVFDEDVPPGSTVIITLLARNSADQTATATLRLSAETISDEIYQLLSRTSFGVTPDMLAEAREMGFDDYLEAQIKGARKVEKKLDTDEDYVKKVAPTKFFSKLREYESEKIRQLMRERLSYLLFSDNHLREVMAVFWDNHFNTTATANDDFYGELMEMRAFREYALGSFRDLLEISAKSSVMMNYLNNNTSAVGAINENYGRELMELHTVGVNAGYTDEDVIQFARVFTGWSEDHTKKSAKARMKNKKKPKHDERVFEFVGENHDGGFKFIPFLDTTIQGSGAMDLESGDFPIRPGIEEGEELLDILATHPTTAGFICTKLVEYFVNDTPPDGVVSSCTQAFLTSDGNIGESVRTILTSTEFRSDPANFRAKYKTPTEYVVGIIRNFGYNANEKRKKKEALPRALDEMNRYIASAGQSWFRYPVPTGFKEDAKEWAASTTMLEQFQYALRAPVRAQSHVIGMGLETPEAIAAGLMDLAMGGRYTRAEYNAVLSELYGSNGRFDINGNEYWSVRRAMQLIAMLPNYQLQ